jgi:hypothetical protein
MSDPFSLPEPPTRDAAQSTAFGMPSGPIAVGGIVMRPFTSFSWDRCQRLGIKIALESFETIKAMSATDILRECALVAWMQSADVREVSRAFAGTDAEIWTEVEVWEAEFNARPDSAKLWLDIVREVTTVMLTGQAVLFAISETEESKKAGAKGEKPPGN